MKQILAFLLKIRFHFILISELSGSTKMSGRPKLDCLPQGDQWWCQLKVVFPLGRVAVALMSWRHHWGTAASLSQLRNRLTFHP